MVIFQGSKEIPNTDEDSDYEVDLNLFSKLCLKIGEPASRRIQGQRKGNNKKLQSDGLIAKPSPCSFVRGILEGSTRPLSKENLKTFCSRIKLT